LEEKMAEKALTMAKHSGMGAIPDASGAGFNAQWDAEFVHSVRRAVIARDDASRDLGAVSRAIEHRYDSDAFKRVVYTESHVVVVVNMTNQSRDGYAIGFPRAGLWKTRFNSDSYNYGPDFANHATPDVDAHGQGTAGLPCSGKISIGPYTVVIFSQDEKKEDV
jgi:1,4-alpha-glucan branching enzyme